MSPMLASDAVLEKLKFPLLASPKLDGIRGMVRDGKVLSRSWKPLPNANLQSLFALRELEGLDGEFILGSPTAKDVYRRTNSVVMSKSKPVDEISFYVFDKFDEPQRPYTHRREAVCQALHNVYSRHLQVARQIALHGQMWIENAEALLQYENDMLNFGYEGLILRAPQSPYKYGRSSAKEGYILKLKRFTDAEAEIIGFEEEMHNTNEAMTNELGRTKRSSAKAGLVGKGTLGALICRVPDTGIVFNIGTGFDADDRAAIWNNQADYLGGLVKYKFFNVGVKEKPRHPVFLGFRDRSDL